VWWTRIFSVLNRRFGCSLAVGDLEASSDTQFICGDSLWPAINRAAPLAPEHLRFDSRPRHWPHPSHFLSLSILILN
jgi:hypothetical protein